jgi:hypothetical protein
MSVLAKLLFNLAVIIKRIGRRMCKHKNAYMFQSAGYDAFEIYVTSEVRVCPNCGGIGKEIE